MYETYAGDVLLQKEFLEVLWNGRKARLHTVLAISGPRQKNWIKWRIEKTLYLSVSGDNR